MRVILYTGKGGVGKTSIAAATACRLAEAGKRVLIMSTDQAHSLGDSFEQSLSGEATAVAPNLDALEINVVDESEKAWKNLRDYMKEMLTAKGSGGIEVEELLVFPGLEELFSLFKILELYEADCYDVLIVDCAPTGETLSLLKYPEMFGNFIEKVLPVKRKAIDTAGPLVEKLTQIPMPEDGVFDDIEQLMDKLGRLRALMLDKKVLSLRIVTTPERIVIQEARRNFTCLHLYNYNVDAIIINKIYPQSALSGYFNRWIELQAEGLAEIQQSFGEIPQFQLELQPRELKSLPVLQSVSCFYGESDPAEVLFEEKIFEIRKKDYQTVLSLHLPLADKNELELSQTSGELRIGIKNEKRCLTLPDSLKRRDIKSARFEDGVLTIIFG